MVPYKLTIPNIATKESVKMAIGAKNITPWPVKMAHVLPTTMHTSMAVDVVMKAWNLKDAHTV